MESLSRVLSVHPWLARLSWLVTVLVLAACNEPTDGGGGPYGP